MSSGSNFTGRTTVNRYFEIIALITAILLGMLFFVSPILSLNNFNHIEREEIEEDIQQTRTILKAEIQQLSTTAGDYAGWDDAYAFMQHADPKFLTSSLGDSFYSKLRLNFFCMIDNDGRIRFSRAHDYMNNVQLPVPPSLMPHLKPGSPLLNNAFPEVIICGFLSLPEGLMMVASRSILTTESMGPPRGRLIIGRFISQNETIRLGRLLGYEIEIFNYVTSTNDPVLRDQFAHFAKTDDVLIQTVSEDHIAGYIELNDIYGHTAGILKLLKSRYIYQQAKQATQMMMIVFGCMCLAVMLILILQRKKLAIVARKKEELKNQFRSFIEIAADGIFTIDSSGDILFVNSRVCEMTGYTRDELQSMRFSQLFEAREADELRLEELLPQDYKTVEQTLLSKKCRIFVELTSKKMPDGTFQCIMHDISKNKAMEHELIEHRNRISSMAIEVSVVEERERNRIAGELHDQVGPNLLLGTLKIDQLQARLPDSEYDDEFEAAKEFINRSIQDIRSLTFQLRPPILANAGLEAALKWLAQDFGQHHGIQVSVQHDETQILLEYSIRVTLFQAARELLLNVVKHASARHVFITVRNDSGIVILTVGDDGVGFRVPRDYAMHSNSFGLFNTNQRIKYHGGQMHIDSSPGRGTRVFITIPLAAAASV